MRDGLVPAVAAAGAASVALVWTLSSSDPYWRLFEDPKIPASAYVSGTDLRAALASAAVEFGNADTGAVTRKPYLPAAAAPAILPAPAAEADAQPVALPAVALADAPRLEPGLDPAPVFARALADAVRPATITGAAEDRTVALAALSTPLPPIGGVLRDEGLVIADAGQPGQALSAFAAPAAPGQPHAGATGGTESALALGRAQRIDIQRRLALAGFDPRGFDGEFGENTRGAVADFQTAWGFPASGYLDAAVIAELNSRTEDAYRALRRQAESQPAAAPAIAPADAQMASADAAGGCARHSDGRIVERQSLACDIAGLSETFAVSFGRSRLAQEDEALAEPAAVPLPAPAAADGDR